MGPDALPPSIERRSRRRAIGPLGTAARGAVGSWLLIDVASGSVPGTTDVGSWALGLIGLPAVVVAAVWARSRRAAPIRASGPMGHVVNLLLFLALYFTFWYAPALSVTSDAALVYYGASMILAAVRGDAGCEVVSVSNWLLRRDDQVGCALFLPIDRAERGNVDHAARSEA